METLPMNDLGTMPTGLEGMPTTPEQLGITSQQIARAIESLEGWANGQVVEEGTGDRVASEVDAGLAGVEGADSVLVSVELKTTISGGDAKTIVDVDVVAERSDSSDEAVDDSELEPHSGVQGKNTESDASSFAEIIDANYIDSEIAQMEIASLVDSMAEQAENPSAHGEDLAAMLAIAAEQLSTDELDPYLENLPANVAVAVTEISETAENTSADHIDPRQRAQYLAIAVISRAEELLTGPEADIDTSTTEINADYLPESENIEQAQAVLAYGLGVLVQIDAAIAQELVNYWQQIQLELAARRSLEEAESVAAVASTQETLSN